MKSLLAKRVDNHSNRGGMHCDGACRERYDKNTLAYHVGKSSVLNVHSFIHSFHSFVRSFVRSSVHPSIFCRTYSLTLLEATGFGIKMGI